MDTDKQVQEPIAALEIQYAMSRGHRLVLRPTLVAGVYPGVRMSLEVEGTDSKKHERAAFKFLLPQIDSVIAALQRFKELRAAASDNEK